MTTQSTIKAILFDLDGTLAYSAQELGCIANLLRIEHGLTTLNIKNYECVISDGVSAILKLALDIDSEHQDFIKLKQQYLNLYQQQVCQYPATLYSGVEELIAQLQSKNIPWGIVTNKHSCFTNQIIANTPALHSAQSIISGDSLNVSKPSAEPLLLAAKQLNCIPNNCIYVGDHPRDIQAAKAAGMQPIFAAYGYTCLEKAGQIPQNNVINTPLALLSIL